jgi:hypothetical protein
MARVLMVERGRCKRWSVAGKDAGETGHGWSPRGAPFSGYQQSDGASASKPGVDQRLLRRRSDREVPRVVGAEAIVSTCVLSALSETEVSGAEMPVGAQERVWAFFR